jgi:hypothetical protein
VVGRNPVGQVRALASSGCGLELTRAASRERTVVLVVLRTNASAVLGANASLAASLPNSAAGAVGRVESEGIVGEARSSERGDTYASAAGAHGEVLRERENEVYRSERECELSTKAYSWPR